MLLSFLICCSFTVIRYIVKRIQVLIKLTQKYFLVYFPHCFIILPDRLLCKTAFHLPALIPSALLYKLCNHSEVAFSHSEAALHEQFYMPLTLPKIFADSCSCPASCVCQHWQKSWGRKPTLKRTPWTSGEGKSYFSTISVPSSCSTTLT